MPDDFKPLTAADVSDLAGVPRRLDLLTSEMRSGFELLGERIAQLMLRIESRLDDHTDRLNDLTRRVEKLEAAQPKARRRTERR